jgi:hypothetical protein
VLDVLLARVHAYGKEGTSHDVVMESFQYAMFCLLVYMCFRDRIGDKTARAIEATQQGLLDSFLNFQVFSPPPGIRQACVPPPVGEARLVAPTIGGDLCLADTSPVGGRRR